MCPEIKYPYFYQWLFITTLNHKNYTSRREMVWLHTHFFHQGYIYFYGLVPTRDNYVHHVDTMPFAAHVIKFSLCQHIATSLKLRTADFILQAPNDCKSGGAGSGQQGGWNFTVHIKFVTSSRFFKLACSLLDYCEAELAWNASWVLSASWYRGRS